MFRISTRTVLQLGAELISSDAVAFYELIKNAFDAGSNRDIVRVVECLPSEKIAEFKELLHSIADLLVRIKATEDAVRKVREEATASVLKTAPEISDYLERIEEAHTPSALLALLDEGSSIEFSGTGEGMSLQELNEFYLTTGTSSCIRTQAAQAGNRTENDRPVLGEKRIGRLSAMRLGMKLEVRTAKKGEPKWKVLSIAWRVCAEEHDALIESVDIKPVHGDEKNRDDQRICILITALNSGWSESKLRQIAVSGLRNLMDPLTESTIFPITVYFNKAKVQIPLFNRLLFDHAHATVSATFSIEDGKSVLRGEVKYLLERKEKTFVVNGVTLKSSAGVETHGTLRRLGPFSMEEYWYNRRIFEEITGISDRKQVKGLIQAWSGGLILFRDCFRVAPYFARRLAATKSLQNAGSSVNGLKYGNFLPLQRPPSVMLAAMYSASITEPVFERGGAHRRDLAAVATAATVDGTEAQAPQEATGSAAAEPSQEPQPIAETVTTKNAAEPSGIAETTPVPAAAQDVVPLFQLGNFLVESKDKPTCLVMNTDYDLQFAPGIKRICDIDQSILLIPGRFELLYERGEEISAKRTELYELRGERFRVILQHARAKSFPYKSVRQEFEPKGYKRQSRRKLPYAREVQQNFAPQLTWVGVPTATSVFREHPIVTYGNAADGTFLNMGNDSNGVVVFHHKDSDTFVLTVDCIHGKLNLIDRFAARIEGGIEAGRVIEAANAASSPQPPTPEPLAPGTHERRGGGNVVRVPGQKSAIRAIRRESYLSELRASSDALSRNYRFHDSLCKLPAIGQSEQHINTISETEKLTRIEVRNATSLNGRIVENAAVVSAFALPRATIPGQPEMDEASMAGIVQQQANLTEGVRATP
jgi:hypothetical protein